MDLEFKEKQSVLTKYHIDPDTKKPITVPVVEKQQIHPLKNLIQMIGEVKKNKKIQIIDRDMISVNKPEKITQPYHYYVDYEQNLIHFHPDIAGQTVEYKYEDMGITVISANKIFTKQDEKGNVVELLQEIIDLGREAIDVMLTIGGVAIIMKRLEDDIKEGYEVSDKIQADIQQAKDEILSVRGNREILIQSSEWTLNDDVYEKEIKHDLNSENLHVTAKNSDTKEAVTIGYKILDKTRILLKSDESINMSIILSASYYHATQTISDNIAEEVVKARKGEVDLKTKIDSIDSEILLANKQLDNIVNQNGNSIIYASDYNIIGDGVTDNTEKFIRLFKDVVDGSTIIIPNGEYIVYTDVEGVTQGDAIPLDKCILLKNKKNITIIGMGNVIIRPNKQGVSSIKKRYPCTLSIDQCENVVVKNINIESKGENFGDADAGMNLAYGDNRTNFTIQNGGIALHVTRSKNVKIYEGEFRFCGSCGVVYFSSVSGCGIYNSFSNPASLGYASYAIDTWADVSNNYSNDVEIINCSSWAETIMRDGNVVGSTKYSSKASVGAEGDKNLCKVIIKGCTFKDCYANSTDKYLGMAIFSYNADILCENNIIENCAYALYKRDTLTNDGVIRFINNTCLNLTTNGIVIKDLYSLNHTKEDIISNNFIHVVGGVTWGGIPYLAHNHGIVVAEIRNGEAININNNTIKVETGTGIVKHFKGSVKASNNNITSGGATLDFYGGGDIETTNNTLTLLGNENDEVSIVYVNTSSIEDTIYDNVRMSFMNNTLIGDKNTRQAIKIISTNANDLFIDRGIKNNNYINCTFNLNKSNYKLKNELQYVKMISKNELIGEYTALKLSFINKNIYNNIKIIDDNGTIKTCQYYSVNENDNYEVTYTVSGDVRNSFTNNIEYIIM